MSIALMNAVWKLDSITSTQKLVLLALADNANDRGECFPSMTMLARKTSLSDRSVRGAVRDLESTGLVLSETRPGTSTLYRLCVQPRNDVPPSEGSAPRNVVPPTPEAGSAPASDDTPEAASAHPGTTFRPPGEPTPEAHSGDPGSSFRPTPEAASAHPGTTFRLTITEPSIEPPPNRHRRRVRDADAVARDVPDWVAWWRDEHGIEMNASDARDRLRFLPLAKQWLARGITFGQMAQAVEEAHRNAREPIAYLPAYAWTILCRGQRPQRAAPRSRLDRQAETIRQLTTSDPEAVDG